MRRASTVDLRDVRAILIFIVKRPGLYAWFAARGLAGRLVNFDLRELHRVTDEALFAEICTRILLTNITTKMTRPSRFDDIQARLIHHLRELRPTKVHDVAVSSGITAVELYRAMEPVLPRVEFHVSDKFSAVKVSRGSPSRVYDLDGNYLFGYVGPIYADPRLRAATKWISKQLGELLRPRQKGVGHETLDRIPLFGPQAAALIREGRASAIDFDIFATHLAPTYDFVRCLNILTVQYFPPDAIQAGVRNLTASIRDGGLLLLGRNVGDSLVTQATLFRKVADRLTVVEDMNGGAEGRDIVLASWATP